MLRAMALSLCILISGCTTNTPFGPCIGAFDDRDPHLIYKPSGWNIALGIVFIETVFVPVIVLIDETQCPIGHKP